MTEQSDFDHLVHLVVYNSLGVTFLLALCHKTCCEARQSELFDNILSNDQ